MNWEYTMHPDTRVEQALVKLRDALCQWERATGRTSVLILRESDLAIRAVDGKPVPQDQDDDVSDEQLLGLVGVPCHDCGGE